MLTVSLPSHPTLDEIKLDHSILDVVEEGSFKPSVTECRKPCLRALEYFLSDIPLPDEDSNDAAFSEQA